MITFFVINLTESKTKAKAKTLAIDFSNPTESDYAALANTCNGLDIGILGMYNLLDTCFFMLMNWYPYLFNPLVNNVGRSHELPVAFAETAVEEQQAIINININATLRVTQIVLKNMIQQCVLLSTFFSRL